ncbi:MAG: 2-C-methyl-D-erythritol 2,4-cyclodiphosphate synthase [Proteobacteria bacterium]|nr:2-C-methyl-D-erythritol 2,4-cyclodiphosphate synthase [Pseudomonadota bacterium]
MTPCIALIVAAGEGERFGGAIPKQYQDLAGSPILRRSQDSVRLGLEAIEKQKPQLVMIHDAARPLIDAETIQRVREALDTHDAAIAAKPLVDTLKRGENDIIKETIDRTNLWQAHTPQGFRFSPILEAHRSVQGRSFTDDAAVAEHAGMRVTLIPSNPDNLKLTNPDDLDRARRLLGMGALPDVRTGFGFDVHRFAPGNSITLCGHTFAHDQSLEGHSDADAGLHALTDAILGAIGEGDIGVHFPPSDPKWKGVDSARFLQHAVDLLRQKGGAVSHIDITFMCERPKIGPQRAAMTKRLSELLKLSPDRIGIKATTTEGLGFTGRGEGLAAQAVVTVRLPFLPDTQ